MAELIKRPELDYEKLAEVDENRPELAFDVQEQVNIEIKYEGYIKRQMQQVAQFKKLEGKKLPENFDYAQVNSLRKEAVQKLNKIQPSTIGQASRISGVSPADISVLMVYLEKASERLKIYDRAVCTENGRGRKAFRYPVKRKAAGAVLRLFPVSGGKNKVMNLTAITEEDAVITKHFCDSLSLVKGFSEIEKTVSLIDVGTGAGLPGIPLKIAFPHLKVTLLDSLNKRVRFLEEVCERLGLENVTCVHARAEDGGRNKDYREKFDLCVSRAVANLSSLSEYCMPFVRVGGYFIPYKSGEIVEELTQAKKQWGF